MTSSFLAVSAAALALGAAVAAAPASAQVAAPPASTQSDNTATHYWYGMFGVTDHEDFSGDLDTVDWRLGARWGWFGLEGEAGWGVNHTRIGNGVTGTTGETANFAGINDQQTIYGVGYLPLSPNIDLFARIGLGRTDFNFKGVTHPADDRNINWNVGGGGQWFWDGLDGVRTEYTKENFDHAANADAWSVSYVRKF